MQNIIKNILNNLENGVNSVTISGRFRKGEVGRLAKRIKSDVKGRKVFVKDMTSYFYGKTSKLRREECRKFETLVEDVSSYHGLRCTLTRQEDGKIGPGFVRVPFCVEVINYETLDKIEQKRKASFLSRFKMPEINKIKIQKIKNLMKKA